METKTCLLIAPTTFYSYANKIKGGLEKLGYTVCVCNDEYPANSIGKIAAKLKLPLVYHYTFERIFTCYLSNRTYDLILIIKGRGMSKKLIKKLRIHSKRLVAYNFDSFNYNSSSLSWYKEVSNYFTFDYSDGEKHNLPIVPLFSSVQSTSPKKIRYDISAIVRNHSNRLSYIDSVLSSIDHKTKFLFIYEQNILTLLFNFIRCPKLYLKYLKFISFKPLPYDNFIDALQSSNFTIDYAHPNQSGITIRCFEALSCGTKIITNNKYVFKFPAFNSNNTVHFHSVKEDDLVRQYEYLRFKTFTPVHRGLQDFVSDLLH